MSWVSVRTAASEAVIAAVIAAMPGGIARAAPPSAPGTCAITSATGLAFGTYDPFSAAPVLVTGLVRHRCARKVLPRITLDGGQGASFAPRWMRSTRDALAYNLYLDAACTEIWGDGSQGTREYDAVTGTANVTIYGRIPPGQDVSAGAYSDVVTVTFEF